MLFLLSRLTYVFFYSFFLIASSDLSITISVVLYRSFLNSLPLYRVSKRWRRDWYSNTKWSVFFLRA